MRDFLSLAKSRRTTYEFTNKKVSDNKLSKILEAGRWAPSSLNTQPWKFVIIKNEKKISELIDNSYYGDFHNSPPTIIALILDGNYLEGNHRGVKDGKIGEIEGYLSIAMPALQICLEAEDLGLNSCILTPDEKKAKKLLNAGIKDRLVIMVGLGYEQKKAYTKKSERKELSKITFNEVIK